MTSGAADWSGLQMFARYAYPPNQRGYCGPDDHMALLHYRDSGAIDGGLADLARSFHGPWPYLKMLAERTGAGGPFSRRVVEAYWIGNELLDAIDTTDFGNTVEERFRPRTSAPVWRRMAEAIPGGFPHHSFHVFVTYPWVGLLEETHRGEPLEILDQCRIRWGRVRGLEGADAVVESRPLEWDRQKLYLGAPRLENVTVPASLSGQLTEGDYVSMHWTWICDRIDRRQLSNLERFSIRQLTMTNEELSHPGPAHVLG
ncbi:MAG: hypothetical protein DWQ40_06090 [Actinobacteria bacterium]|nr:MAG: hypothetical protein DWQ40_06090 [Actinomycetota bacterium]REK40766.1 MAG: hypothetical protein DWQ20_01220 [Actinomycetota bacterium]